MLQEITDEEFEYFQELEKKWRSTLKTPNQIAEELLRDDPEISKDLPEILKEVQEEKVKDEEKIKGLLRHAEKFPEPDRTFWKELIKHLRYQQTLDLEKRVYRIQNLIQKTKKRKRKNVGITEDQIQRARERSIIEIVEHNLPKVIKRGNRGIANCPFHADKTPSLVLFATTNSWYCFGCQKGGDPIAFVRELHGFSFKEAVQNITF